MAGPVAGAGAQAVEIDGVKYPDATDFYVTDPVTGKSTFDTDAYLAAVAALNATQGTGSLPVTGSSSTDFAVLGLAMIAVGSATVVATRRRKA